jgi:hypothetical protein
MAPRLPAAEKVRRDTLIVADRAGGLRWSTIAQKHNLSEQHARQIWKERLAAEPLEPLDGRDTITEALLQTEARIEELALLAESTNNDAIKLGAIRARGEAMSDRHDLLRLAGYMPISWVAAHTEADIHRMGENIIAVLEKHGVFSDVVDDLLAALRRPGVGVPSNGHKR